MHGSDAPRDAFGHYDPHGTYDLPCSDNVSFMIQDKAVGMTRSNYLQNFNTTNPLTTYQSMQGPIAMHSPLYPGVNWVGDSGTKISEEITFSLEKDLSSVLLVNLHILVASVSPEEYIPSVFTRIDNTAPKRASWSSTGPGTFTPTLSSGGHAFDNVSFITCFPDLVGGQTTFITYRFEVTYIAGSTVPSNPENFDVTFALNDFNLESPVPVYAQANSDQVVDVLFIPARDQSNAPLDDAFKNSFDENCRSLIKDHIFFDPTVKFWRKQFNFWISLEDGQAISYDESSSDCHDTPEIPSFIEVSGVLHNNASQRNFKCNEVFSAYVKNGNKVLHELGHAAFYLEDEYRTATNYEERINHFPNIWETRVGAENNATYRHKMPGDVKKLVE